MISKNTRRLFLAAQLVPRWHAPPTDRPLALALVGKRLAEIGTKREQRSRAREARRAEHGVISGGEESTYIRAAVISGCEVQIAFAVRPQSFRPAALRSCARGAYSPAPRGAQGAPKKWSHRRPLQGLQAVVVVSQVNGVDMGVKCVNVGKHYAIIRLSR